MYSVVKRCRAVTPPATYQSEHRRTINQHLTTQQLFIHPSINQQLRRSLPPCARVWAWALWHCGIGRGCARWRRWPVQHACCHRILDCFCVAPWRADHLTTQTAWCCTWPARRGHHPGYHRQLGLVLHRTIGPWRHTRGHRQTAYRQVDVGAICVFAAVFLPVPPGVGAGGVRLKKKKGAQPKGARVPLTS